MESRLYVQVGTQKLGRRTERDKVKVIFRKMPCKVFRTRLYQLDVQTSGSYNWETYSWDSTVIDFQATVPADTAHLNFLRPYFQFSDSKATRLNELLTRHYVYIHQLTYGTTKRNADSNLANAPYLWTLTYCETRTLRNLFNFDAPYLPNFRYTLLIGSYRKKLTHYHNIQVLE